VSSCRRHVSICASLTLVIVLVACTGPTQTDLSSPNKTGLEPAPLEPSPTPVVANPQPAKCPRKWEFSPVPGSDTTLVPGSPVAAVSCSLIVDRHVIGGHQLNTLVRMLNSRRHVVPRGYACPAQHDGAFVVSSQLYSNYDSGDIQTLDFNPRCRTVSNGKITASFGQYTTDQVSGSS
jgi:hypothetical protein